jgi:tripartite-type tricarboxylate transporter receptor subunit TctC
MVTRSRLTSVVFGLFAALVAQSAGAEGYPDRAVKIVVPYPAGGPIDLIGRLLAQTLPKVLGGQFYVENVPGAAGTIGMRAVATAPADGYTILIANENLVLQPIIKASVPFDPFKSFVPVSLVATAPMMVVINPSVQANSVKELIELLKANPGKYNYASPGFGSSPHLASERLFNLTNKLKVVHVPFQGAAPAVQAVLTGEPPIFHEVLPAVLQHIEQGKMRALAIASAQRSRFLPNVPTLAEAGFPDHEVGFWCGVLLPAGVPQDVAVKLNGAIGKALSLPEFRDRLVTLAFEPAYGSQEAFAEHLKSVSGKWRKVIDEANIKID